MTSFLEIFTECVIEMDSQYIITTILRRADSESLLNDVVGKSFLDIFSEKDRVFVESELDRLKNTSVPYLRFQLMTKSDGYFRWTLSAARKNGVISAIHGIAVDVVDINQKEITLNWQRAVMEESRDFVRIFDMERRALYTNPGAYKMTGYDPNMEMPSSEQIYTSEHYKTVYEEGLEEISKSGFWIGRGELVRSDGTLIPIEHTMFSIKNEQSEVILMASVIRDITVFFEHEQKLEKARLAAEVANVAKSEFLSRMSHEIRTPMNAIIGMIDIGLGTDDVDKMKYCFRRADSAAKHLLSLINDILDMSKIEADKFELSYSLFDFETSLKNVANIANVKAEEKQLEFVVNLSSDVPAFILCDEMRLSQVIMNLLTNAIKFTPEKGRVSLYIEKTEEIDDDVVIKIEVADTGIGISKEQQKRLFESFSQADANISQKYGGTGLGLAISKRIVEFMGGKIWVESELGKGSKFAFTVRTKKVEVESLESADDASERRYNFSGRNILIAEDIEINREIISAILEETGVSVDYAENGSIAVSKFKADPGKYDLILMDINMPEMDGYEATRQIRALSRVSAGTQAIAEAIVEAMDVTIIAMTANVFKEDIEKCLAAGMNDHIGKPINRDELFSKLSKFLCSDMQDR
jgi:PAS domain S-box-containing protein